MVSWFDRISNFKHILLRQICGALVSEIQFPSQVQDLINWSWTKGVNFECILGIIALRRLPSAQSFCVLVVIYI